VLTDKAAQTKDVRLHDSTTQIHCMQLVRLSAALHCFEVPTLDQ